MKSIKLITGANIETSDPLAVIIKIDQDAVRAPLRQEACLFTRIEYREIIIACQRKLTAPVCSQARGGSSFKIMSYAKRGRNLGLNYSCAPEMRLS